MTPSASRAPGGQAPQEWSPYARRPARLVRPVRLDQRGRTGPTEAQARSKRWRRTSQGWYVPAEVDSTVPEQRILEASVVLPAGGAVTGWAAIRWRGAGYFDGRDRDGITQLPVELVVGGARGVRDRPGLRVVRESLHDDEWTMVDGLPCTRPERATIDAMRRAKDLPAAVEAADMAMAAELTSLSRLRRHLPRHGGRRGMRQARRALDLADERSLSPGETRTRLAWVLRAGLPRPLVNQPVFDLRGRLLAVADLFDPEAGMVGEYDGAAHRAAQRHRRDVMREHALRQEGLEYVKVVARDLRQIDVLVDRLLTTRARAAWAAPGRRRWTLTPPEGWYNDPMDAMSLDERLEYRAMLHQTG